jgi:5-formyltetrahydrofolate cyclo-ligase
VITGLGFTEILAVLVLVLIFFGSKELPHFIREAGRLMNRLRRYSDQVRRELDEVSRSVDPNVTARAERDSTAERKAGLRKRFRTARSSIASERRNHVSATIVERLVELDEIRRARAVMVYLHTGNEVRTDTLISRLLSEGKRVIVPYCRPASRDLGIAEIRTVDSDTAPGLHGIREPLPALRGNFLKSDIHAIVVPGVAFDTHGGRLGQGKGYYDNFLRELSGRVPFIGLAFACQISDEPFPFDYHDVAVDQVVTENGPLIEQRTPSSSQFVEQDDVVVD